MNLMRIEPWSIAGLVRRDLDRLAGNRADPARAETRAVDWTPAIDIIEEKTRFVLRADLPGVSPEDVDLSVQDGYLTISGERKTEDRSNADGIERYERITGRFLRRFALPETADIEAISAKSDNGTLEVAIPKLAQVQPRRINVEAA